MTDEVSFIRKWTKLKARTVQPTAEDSHLYGVREFLIIDTSKGIVLLIPWSCVKEKKQIYIFVHFLITATFSTRYSSVSLAAPDGLTNSWKIITIPCSSNAMET